MHLERADHQIAGQQQGDVRGQLWVLKPDGQGEQGVVGREPERDQFGAGAQPPVRRGRISAPFDDLDLAPQQGVQRELEQGEIRPPTPAEQPDGQQADGGDGRQPDREHVPVTAGIGPQIFGGVPRCVQPVPHGATLGCAT